MYIYIYMLYRYIYNLNKYVYQYSKVLCVCYTYNIIHNIKLSTEVKLYM